MKLPTPFESWGEHATVTLRGAQVVFTTRRGGFSTGRFESLNLGRLTDDTPEAVARNRRQLQEQVGGRLAMVRQVHGSTIHAVDTPPTGPDAPPVLEGDGVLTGSNAVAPAVLVADCLPVAVAGAGAVAMLHAGWRGLSEGILEKGVRMLRDGGADNELEAAIGPGIGVCCYEVGEEVHEAFASYGSDVRRGSKLDLRAVARRQLERAGVTVVGDLDLCTACRPELFFSHRRDHGVTGRQAGVAWLS